MQFRNSRFLSISATESKLLLSGVVFGINTSSSDIELVKSALAKGKFPQRVNLYQARAVKDDFTIDVRKIGHVEDAK